MSKPLLMFALLLLALGLASPANASSVTYTAVLTGASEVPPSGSLATGVATITLNGDLLSVNESFSGLTGGLASAAHIHCCAPPGTNAGVAVPFTGFPTTTSGTYTNTFDLTLTSTYLAAFLTASGGTAASAEAALIAGLNSGQTYANIHNTQFPGGEIRGFITVATPEPEGLWLLGTGMIGLLQAVRRRVRA